MLRSNKHQVQKVAFAPLSGGINVAVPPEVKVNLQGGNTGVGVVIPHIVSTDKADIDGRYFEVELLNSTGGRVTGFITWQSIGY